LGIGFGKLCPGLVLGALVTFTPSAGEGKRGGQGEDEAASPVKLGQKKLRLNMEVNAVQSDPKESGSNAEEGKGWWVGRNRGGGRRLDRSL